MSETSNRPIGGFTAVCAGNRSCRALGADIWACSSVGCALDKREVGSSSLGPPFLLGAVAQLGERLLCKQEVVGSIPSGSRPAVGHFLGLEPLGLERDRHREIARLGILMDWAFDLRRGGA